MLRKLRLKQKNGFLIKKNVYIITARFQEIRIFEKYSA